MTIKKKLTILLVGVLSICLFFAFGFQIDVGVVGDKTGGTAEVSLDPLRIAANEANAALKAAQLALEEVQAALAVVRLIAGDPIGAVAAAEKAVTDAQLILDDLLLLGLPPDNPDVIAAQLALEEAQAALAVVQLIAGDPIGAVAAAEKAVKDALAALETAILAADEANTAFSGFKTKDDEELKELQLEVEKAQAALDEAKIEGDEEKIAELQEELDKAIAALEEGESGESGNKFFHVITNSNNGGSFDMEGNYSDIGGVMVPYTFTAEKGFELVWLRIGNIKILASDLDSLLDGFSFDKKNLTIHAHFKKDKDSSPEITTEETGEPVEDEKGNGKGKDKEKSNNGKKKDK